MPLTQTETHIMQRYHRNAGFDLSTFAVTGFSYRQTALTKRGTLAFDGSMRAAFYARLQQYRVPYAMLLSTCNRTEVYIGTPDLTKALEIWTDLTGQPVQNEPSLFVYTGRKALEHLFKVMAGADSQIPGDMQITAQVKDAFVEAQKTGMCTGLFERIMNSAVHCSRKVKTETDLTSGASSIPSAVFMAIKEAYGVPVKEKIAVIGMGKMGTLSCQNILKITPPDLIAVVNRTGAKASDFAKQSGTRYMPFPQMTQAVRRAGIIIVSTTSDTPLIHKRHLDDGRRRMIFDLSVPHNVDPAVATLQGVQLINLDQLASIAKKHIQYRQDQLDDVHRIINHQVDKSFEWWYRRRRYHALRVTLHEKRHAEVI